MTCVDQDERALNTERTAYFLQQIGLNVRQKPGQKGFLTGCKIVDGELFFDSSSCAANLLHEAGHIAIVPTIFRHGLSDNVDEGFGALFENDKVRNLSPDHPLMRALLQCGDCEATAWAWAAGCAIGLPPSEIIRNRDYGSSGAMVRTQLLGLSYLGIHGLHHAGLCRLPRAGGFPTMLKWLQDASFDTVWDDPGRFTR